MDEDLPEDLGHPKSDRALLLGNLIVGGFLLLATIGVGVLYFATR